MFTFYYLDSNCRDENQRLHQLKAELQQLQLKGQSFCTERETNRRLETGLSEKIRRKLDEKKKLSMKLTQLHNAREEEESVQDMATYVSEASNNFYEHLMYPSPHRSLR